MTYDMSTVEHVRLSAEELAELRRPMPPPRMPTASILLPPEPPMRLTRWGRLLVWLGLQRAPVGRQGRRTLGH